jgi:hypothetical protein
LSFIGGGSNNTINAFRYSSILGGQSNTVNHQNAHIIGSNTTSVSANTTHVERLNIKTLNGTAINVGIGLDINGMVVSGDTSQSFTGNTSGDCITDLYVTNLYGCSPLHIEPTGLNDVYITENGGNVGVGRVPEKKLDVLGETRLSGGGQNILTVIGSGSTSPLFTVEGSQGELLTVTDDTDLSILRVNNSATNPVLDVLDDDTIMMGNYLSPSLNTTAKINPGTGLTNVYSLPVSAHTGAWFDYTVINTTGARSGQIMSIFSGSTVQFTENATSDIGSTTPVTFTMSSDGANATLQVSATTTGWEVKTIIRSI